MSSSNSGSYQGNWTHHLNTHVEFVQLLQAPEPVGRDAVEDQPAGYLICFVIGKHAGEDAGVVPEFGQFTDAGDHVACKLLPQLIDVSHA